MATFQFIATDKSGQEVRGTIEAADRASAIASIRAQQYFPSAIGEVKAEAPAVSAPAKGKKGAPSAKKSGGLNKSINLNIKLPKFLMGRVKAKDLTTFTRQLSTLVNAGLPLMRCIDVLKRQNSVPALKDALDGISDAIAGGATFSDALTAYPKIFDNLYVNMVKAGEAGGVLDVVLTRLAEFAEKSDKIKNKVKGAMIYPTVVLFAALGITGFLLTYVIPKFQQVFTDLLGDAAMPALTQFVIDLSEWVKQYWYIVIAGAAALWVIKKVIGMTPAGAYMYDVISIKTPVTGTLIKRTAISRVTRTLGTLLASGVPILQALVIVRDTTGNRVVSKALQNVHDSVKEGESMSDPLAQSGVFPPMVVSMVQVGEETGALSDMLTRIANTYDDEVDNAVAGLTAAIEPALIIVLAVIVGTIIVAMFMPMIKIISNVGGGGGAM